jgi:hypothetical protein
MSDIGLLDSIFCVSPEFGGISVSLISFIARHADGFETSPASRFGAIGFKRLEDRFRQILIGAWAAASITMNRFALL